MPGCQSAKDAAPSQAGLVTPFAKRQAYREKTPKTWTTPRPFAWPLHLAMTGTASAALTVIDRLERSMAGLLKLSLRRERA
jgi:hypothetical protein